MRRISPRIIGENARMNRASSENQLQIPGCDLDIDWEIDRFFGKMMKTAKHGDTLIAHKA